MIAAPEESDRKLWSAWSPDKLDPWSPPVLSDPIKAVPTEFWLTHQLLPVRVERVRDREILVVAASAADVDPFLLLELRKLALRPVRLAPASGDDVEFWLDVLFRGRDWFEALTASLGRTLEFSGAIAPKARWSAGQDVSVKEVAAAFGLSEDVALEALALRARLPQIRLEQYPLTGDHVSHLLPDAAAARFQTLPVVVRRGLVLAASPRVHTAETRTAIQHEIGLPARFCLCSHNAFERAFGMLYPVPSPESSVQRPGSRVEAPESRVLSPNSTLDARLGHHPTAPPADRGQETPDPALDSPDWPAEDEVLRLLVHMQILNERQADSLRILARLTLETALQAAIRLRFVNQEQLARARAGLLGLLFIDENSVHVDENLAAYGSPELWRRWACIPLHVPGQGATLAGAVPLPETLREAANRLAGVNFELALLTESTLERALSSAPVWRKAPYLPEHHLLETGLIRATSEILAAASRLARSENIPLVDAFLKVGAIEMVDLLEAKAVAANCPWVHLDRYAAQPGVAELIPDFWATSERVLAFRRRGATLSVALINGQDELPAGLEAMTGLAIEPVLALAGDVEKTFERWYQSQSAALPQSYRELEAYLVRRNALSSSQFEQAWDSASRLGTPLDAALAATIGGQRVAQLLAEFRGLRVRDLDLIPETRDFFDPLGKARTETLYRDPVDHALAQRLPRDTSTRLAALPLELQGGTMVVAVADPLDAAVVAELEAVLGTSIELQVSERDQIERARGRVWNIASLGERLVVAGLIDTEELRQGLKVCAATGVRLGEALMSIGAVNPTELAYFLAEQAGVPYFDLGLTLPDPEITALMPPPTGGRASYLPLYREADGTLVLAVPDPLSARELAAAAEQLGFERVRQVVVAATAFHETLDEVFRTEFHTFSASALMTRSPEQSARWVLNRAQKVVFLLATAALIGGLVRFPIPTATSLMALATLFYVGFSTYKFYLAYSALAHTLEIETTDEEVEALDERFLPVYTILTPLYRETEVLPVLVRAIDRLDYPKPKLDVKLLLEEDDEETIRAARQAGLPSHFQIVIVPRGLPKGKPKACNYGLIYARGEYVVIFDAEDLPERDQLKKALVAFSKADDRLACVQAKLNYFNRDQNLLTRWFTTEYSMWFDLFLPGLDASHAPIPLGGTSNHFRTQRLRELGAWDPYNVTEDADLGARLFKLGWKTAVIDSTTYEEANSQVYNWIRQRSRWVKGYIQTYLVHMRNPIKLFRELGLKDFFSFQMVIAGTFIGFLANPVFWVMTAGWFIFQWPWIKQIFPPALFYLGAFNLYLGNFAFTYLNVAGCLKRGYYDMVKYALLSPIYWSLMSVAAWKGFLQLFYKPSYWEKTNHGLYQGEIPQEGRAAALAA